MRNTPAALVTLNQSGAPSLAWGMKVTRSDAQVFGFTSAQASVAIGGVVYVAKPAVAVNGLESVEGFGVDNTELTIYSDETIITMEDVLAKRWDGAAFELFEFNWANPSDGRDIHKRGKFGTVSPRNGAYKVELRSLRQAFTVQAIETTQPTCRNELGDAKCGVDLGPITHNGTISAVTSNRVFRDATIGQAADYFRGGVFTWLTGNNAGITVKVSGFAADGTFTLDSAMVLDVQIGDTYSAIRGCMKRLDEDCATIFANELNFWGEPHVPGGNAVIETPDPAESGA